MANKHDLLAENPTREVSEEDILDFTKRTGLTVFEASAKTGHGVESSFISLTDALMDGAESKKPIEQHGPETQSSNGNMIGYGNEAEKQENLNYNDY